MLSMKKYIDDKLADVKVSDKLNHTILSKTLYGKNNAEEGRRMSAGTRKKLVVAAAAVCLAVGFSATAFATNLFGLRDMVMEKTQITDPMTGVTTSADLVALQGYPESDEYKACAEWTAFCDSYDVDGALLDAIGNGDTGLDEKYYWYSPYTQEMADKLQEIVDKYSLRMYKEFTAFTGDETSAAIGVQGLMLPGNYSQGGYKYDDGTFSFAGDYDVDGMTASYQFGCYKKGSFSETMLNIGDIADYEEWEFTNATGTQMRMALSPYKAILIIDTGSSFVTINVLCGTESDLFGTGVTMNRQQLEGFANSFDFTVLK